MPQAQNKLNMHRSPITLKRQVLLYTLTNINILKKKFFRRSRKGGRKIRVFQILMINSQQIFGHILKKSIYYYSNSRFSPMFLLYFIFIFLFQLYEGPYNSIHDDFDSGFMNGRRKIYVMLGIYQAHTQKISNKSLVWIR